MSKLRIVLLNPPILIPSHYKDADGLVSFDLDRETVIAITKQIADTDVANDLLQDTVRAFALPNTEKNTALLGVFGNPNLFNTDLERGLRVKISYDMYVLMEDRLMVKSTGDKAFEVEVYGAAHTWISGLQAFALNSLNIGLTPPYNEALLNHIHAYKNKYIDGELPIFIPIANYGKRAAKNYISITDLRIWHSLYYLLKASFCAIGWQFVCPMLDSDYGRRLWVYILAADFSKLTSEASAARGFNVQLVNNQIVEPWVLFSMGAGTVIFDNDTTTPAFNNGGYYNITTGEYQGSNIRADYFAELEITGTVVPGNTSPGVLVLIVRKNLITNVEDYAFIDRYDTPTNRTYNIKVELLDFYLSSNESLSVWCYDVGFTCVLVKDKCFFWNNPIDVEIGRGDLIDVAAIIDPKIKALDLLKGAAHLFRWNYETDAINRTVSFYPEEGGELFEQGEIEAYYKDNGKALDWTDKIHQNSLNVPLNLNSKKRNFVLEFKKDDQDDSVKGLDLEDGLYSKSLDFGSYFKEGVQKSTNPFFAPTINRFDSDIASLIGVPPYDLSAPYIIHILKGGLNEKGELPKPISRVTPRIILSHEYRKVTSPAMEGNSAQRDGRFNIYNEDFPDGYTNGALYAASAQLFPFGFTQTELISGTIYPLSDRSVAFSTHQFGSNTSGLYEALHLEAIKRTYSTTSLEFLAKISFIDFLNFSHRSKVLINYRSKTLGMMSFYARVSSLTDFVINKDILTPITLAPNLNRINISCEACNVVIAPLIFIGTKTITTTADSIGDCSPILSYKWELTLVPFSPIVAIGTSDELRTISLKSTSISSLWQFTLQVTITTANGTFTDSITYP